MTMNRVLLAATAVSVLTAGAAMAETITIATVNNGDMIRMQG
jgi:sorbitol/mannitol transport system substrate-binding protein